MPRVIPSGDRYHARSADCDMGKMMAAASGIDAISKREAEQRGMDPCPECFSED